MHTIRCIDAHAEIGVVYAPRPGSQRTIDAAAGPAQSVGLNLSRELAIAIAVYASGAKITLRKSSTSRDVHVAIPGITTTYVVPAEDIDDVLVTILDATGAPAAVGTCDVWIFHPADLAGGRER